MATADCAKPQQALSDNGGAGDKEIDDRSSSSPASEPPIKRKRGRPRKTIDPSVGTVVKKVEKLEELEKLEEKRLRGRARKIQWDWEDYEPFDPIQTSSSDEDDCLPLRCEDCDITFTGQKYLYDHLYYHIKDPKVSLERLNLERLNIEGAEGGISSERVRLPSLKLTLKATDKQDCFQIVQSPPPLSSSSNKITDFNLAEHEDEGTSDDTGTALDELPQEKDYADTGSAIAFDDFEGLGLDELESDVGIGSSVADGDEEDIDADDPANVSFSPNFANADDPSGGAVDSPIGSEGSSNQSQSKASISEIITTTKTERDDAPSEDDGGSTSSTPGAQPTPPLEPSPAGSPYPKIRIKTMGLLKEPLTITEITDDNPDGIEGGGSGNHASDSGLQRTNMWNNLEDPLKLPDDSNLLSLFNNNERAKDLGFTTSDSEFISLDRLDERNRSAMQLYQPPGMSNNQQSALSNALTGLPMEALAQQVSRLQPSGGNGMHQQNVLINIQQFPQPPPQYQPPPMYHPHHPPQPMYHQPYPYPPQPAPMYYPPGPAGYPPQHMAPPQPQLGQIGPGPMNPQGNVQMGQQQPPQGQIVVSQPQQVVVQPQGQQQQQQGYRQPLAPRPPQGPRGPMQMQGGPRGPGGAVGMRPQMGGAPRQQPMQRQRPPMLRPKGSMVGPQMGQRGAVGPGGMRPRMPMMNGGQVRMGQNQQHGVKRTPEQIQALQAAAKKKRFDVLTPDKDDEDCQVICMQPKNTDGGLPQIQSVQGGQSEPSSAESSVMHLSDSITLSVRNPPPRPASPKKSDAKAVANILATRGITVTATPKAKEAGKSSDPSKNGNAALNLNGAVSIIPSAKTNSNTKSSSGSASESHLPTVDLTDDTSGAAGVRHHQPQQNMQQNKQGHPQQRQQGLPFKCDLCQAQYPKAIDLSKHRQNYHRTAGGMCEIGVPLINLKQPGIFQKLGSLGIFSYIPLPSADPSGMFAVPIINARNPGNVGALGATQMLSLGPIRSIPRPQQQQQQQQHHPNNQGGVANGPLRAQLNKPHQ